MNIIFGTDKLFLTNDPDLLIARIALPALVPTHSAEDAAVVIADEMENPKYIRQRFTVAY